jgi:hypothetical protein
MNSYLMIRTKITRQKRMKTSHETERSLKIPQTL